VKQGKMLSAAKFNPFGEADDDEEEEEEEEEAPTSTLFALPSSQTGGDCHAISRLVLNVCVWGGGWPTNNREAKGAAQLVIFVVVIVQESEADQEGPICGGPQRSRPRTERGTPLSLSLAR
jgi:hypothetical protein